MAAVVQDAPKGVDAAYGTTMPDVQADPMQALQAADAGVASNAGFPTGDTGEATIPRPSQVHGPILCHCRVLLSCGTVVQAPMPEGLVPAIQGQRTTLVLSLPSCLQAQQSGLAALQQLGSALTQTTGEDGSMGNSPVASGTSSYGSTTQAVVDPKVEPSTAAALAAQYGGSQAAAVRAPPVQAADASATDATPTALSQPTTAAVGGSDEAPGLPTAASGTGTTAVMPSQAAGRGASGAATDSSDGARTTAPAASSIVTASPVGARVPMTGALLPADHTTGASLGAAINTQGMQPSSSSIGAQPSGYNAGMPTSEQQSLGGLSGLVAAAMLGPGRRLQQLDVNLP